MDNNEQNLNLNNEEAAKTGESHCDGTSEIYGKARRVRSRRKFLKATLVTLIAFLLVITCTGTAILLPLLRDYNQIQLSHLTIHFQKLWAAPDNLVVDIFLRCTNSVYDSHHVIYPTHNVLSFP